VNYNFTQRGVPEISSGASGAGRLNYEMPVITVMPGHREQSSFVGLQQTLVQLGFDNGSALLKLSFRNSGTPLEEAMAEISQYFKSSDAGSAASGAHAATSAQSASVPSPDKAAPEVTQETGNEPPTDTGPEQMDVDPPPALKPKTEDAVPSPSPSPTTAHINPLSGIEPQGSPHRRNIQVFAAPTSSTPQAARRAFNENDYEPTIEHAKAHQASLQARTRNQRLLSDKELEEQEKARLEKLKQAAETGGSIRIRMPDQTIVQFNISKADTAEGLYALVNDFLEFKDQPFLLKYMGPKGTPVTMQRTNERLIQDLRFSGRDLVTFIWDDKASIDARLSRMTLTKEWQARAQTLKVEEPVVDSGPEAASSAGEKSEGKRSGGSMSNVDKESKLKSILGKGLFKKR